MSQNNDISEFYDNIGTKKQFNVLYTMYMNLLQSQKLSDNYDDDEELYSTLTLGLITCLKTVSYTSNRKILVVDYIKNVITMLNTTNYEERDYTSIKEWIISLFSTQFKTSVVPQSIYDFSEDDSYYEAQKKMCTLLNPYNNLIYNASHINIFTLGYFAFLMVVHTIPTNGSRKYLINDYLKTLANIVNNNDEIINEPHLQKVEFDFTHSN